MLPGTRRCEVEEYPAGHGAANSAAVGPVSAILRVRVAIVPIDQFTLDFPLTTLSMSLIGDWLRDRLDPTIQRGD